MITRRSAALAAAGITLALALGVAAHIVRFDIAAVPTGGTLVLDRWAGSVSHCASTLSTTPGAVGSYCRQIYPAHRVEAR